MNKKKYLKKTIKTVLILILLFSTIAWLLITGAKLIVIIYLVIFIPFSIILLKKKSYLKILMLYMILILVPLSPYDISLINYPGFPKFVPLIMGLPTQELFDRADAGEVVLGGCFFTGFESRWILVW